MDSRRLRRGLVRIERPIARWLMRIWNLWHWIFFFLPAASVEPVDYIKLVSEPRSLCIHHRRFEEGERGRERGCTFRLLREGELLDLETAQLVVVVWFFCLPFVGRLMIISWQLPWRLRRSHAVPGVWWFRARLGEMLEGELGGPLYFFSLAFSSLPRPVRLRRTSSEGLYVS